MHQVQVTDQLYQEAQRRAAEAGFVSVDEYIADVLKRDLQDDTENLDHFFTQERLAHIDKAAAQIKAGESFTSEQVREHFNQKREA
jgi:PHD/YefM family antitoxin component YafN of YafNO toxin-antitoxin module